MSGNEVVTSLDVARLAGVSQPTVSRALRGEAGMSEQTRRRVHDAAASLGYVPIDRGRSLSSGRTRRIGVVSPELTNPFYPDLIESIRTALERSSYRPLLLADRTDGEDALAVLADGSLDGVIMTTALLDSQLAHQLRARRIPVVMVNREIDGESLDSCVIDNEQGAQDVAELLVGLGHRRIAAILGPPTTSTSRDRERGLRQGLARHRLTLPAARLRRGDYSHATGYRATLELLGTASPPTAIACLNDVIALGACSAVLSRGLELGRDVSVVGFDDIPMAQWYPFSLTTVHCDVRQLAESAVRLLLDRVAAPGRAARRIVIPAPLVLRSTHGPLAG